MKKKIPNQFDIGENKAGLYIQAEVKRHHHDNIIWIFQRTEDSLRNNFQLSRSLFRLEKKNDDFVMNYGI